MSDNENLNENKDLQNKKIINENKKVMGMAIGSCIGVAFASGVGTGFGVDNLGACVGIGIAVGMGVGLAVGSIMENKNKKE